MFKNYNYQKENLMLCVVLLVKAVIKKTDDLKITVDSDISRSDSNRNYNMVSNKIIKSINSKK